MSQDPIDAYLAELIGEATPSAPPQQALPPSGPALPAGTDPASPPEASLDLPGDATVSQVAADAAACPHGPEEPIAAQTQRWTHALLEELDGDPLFAPTASTPPGDESPATAVTPAAPTDWQHLVIEEMARDPQFVAVNDEAPAPEADRTAASSPVVTADQTDHWTNALLAELDSDPLFEGQSAPVAVATAAAPSSAVPASDTGTWTNDLLAELDSDPLFEGQSAPAAVATAAEPSSAVAASDTSTWTNDLLAELADDPLFADQTGPAPLSRSAASQPDVPLAAQTDVWTNDLLAELDADPNFAAPDTTPPATAPVAPATPASLPGSPQPVTGRSAGSTTPTPLWQAKPLDRAESDPDRPQRTRATDRVSRWLRLRCGDQPYALELLKVQEVVLLSPLLRLRGTPPHMLGIMNLRGQVVPVMDLGIFLGGTPTMEAPSARIIVLESEGQTLGLRVTAVEDVATLTDSQIEPPDTTRLCRFSNHIFRGVARLGGPPMILLDADALLN